MKPRKFIVAWSEYGLQRDQLTDYTRYFAALDANRKSTRLNSSH